jgi:peptidyl-tRNA hydrolase, PTH1 family
LSAQVELIVGLGNPGKDYASTRHNAGFWFIDAFAQQHKTGFTHEKKFHAEVARCQWHGRDLWLLKPQTYMNLSGQSVQTFMQFYKIALINILVVHDELDLPTGVVRLKLGGGAGGHNGLRDIIEKCGGNDFARLRIGIGHPGDKAQVTGHVLNKVSREDDSAMRDAIERALVVLPQVLDGDMQKAMNQLHTEKSM